VCKTTSTAQDSRLFRNESEQLPAAIGGLAGADAHCQKLAETVGSRKRSWRAYLSATAESGRPMNAKDRIGRGPWFNARGMQVAGEPCRAQQNPRSYLMAIRTRSV
jgi:hypothetical protein